MGSSDDFFEAYTAAPDSAAVGLIVKQPELFDVLTETFYHAIEAYADSS